MHVLSESIRPKLGDGGAAAGQVAEPSPLATAAGFVALVLVASSLFLYAWPPLLLLVSMLAVPLAAWSISGRNRRFAIVVLLFACLIMAGGIYGTAMWRYTQTYGRSFWQAPSDDEFGVIFGRLLAWRSLGGRYTDPFPKRRGFSNRR